MSGSATIALRGAELLTAGVLKRVATAIVLIPAFVWIVVAAPSWVFPLVVVLVSAVAAAELARLFQRSGRPVYPAVGVACGALVTASFLVAGAPAFVVTAAIIVVLGVAVLSAPPATIDAAVTTMLGVMWINWLLGHGLLLWMRADGAALILLLVGTTWAGETAAWAIGSSIGRHKLASQVSPGKTVEGAIAQFVVSAVAGLLLGGWLLPQHARFVWLGAGALLGVTGQFGDLAESVVKRSVGAKDASALIPGHGGLLDRIDGLIFNAAALYYYASAIGAGA